MVEFCRARAADGEQCPCEEFSPLAENSLTCAECSHGKSKHPKPAISVLGAAMPSKMVRVGSVVVILTGFDDKGHLNVTKPPTRTQLAELEQQGCAKYQTPDLVFDPTWDHQEVHNWLERLLPLPFEYACMQPGANQPGVSPWILLSKESGRLSIAPTQCPTGQDLQRYKGREKCRVVDSSVYVALRAAVPPNVSAEWRTKKSEPGDDITDGGSVQYEYTVPKKRKLDIFDSDVHVQDIKRRQLLEGNFDIAALNDSNVENVYVPPAMAPLYYATSQGRVTVAANTVASLRSVSRPPRVIEPTDDQIRWGLDLDNREVINPFTHEYEIRPTQYN